MDIRVGTSGYSFEDWRGPFYPADTEKGKMLDHYVRHFPTVEINSTYYRIPRPAVAVGRLREPAKIAGKLPEDAGGEKMNREWSQKLKLLFIFSIVAITAIFQTTIPTTRQLLLLPIAAMALMEISCTDTISPGDFFEIPPDAHPSWDSDGDGISTAVETNSANSYLGLDTNVVDANPSLARGWPCSTQCVGVECGWIDNALNLMNENIGYYHYNIDSPGDVDDWGTLHLINMIEGAGRDWYNYNWPPPRIGVGDMSKGDQFAQQFGGYFDPHVCHQNGTEADFRYVRNDRIEDALNIRTQPSLYDLAGTKTLMKCLFRNSSSIKIIVSPYCGITFNGIEVKYDSAWKHDDHFHLRIEDPDGTGN